RSSLRPRRLRLVHRVRQRALGRLPGRLPGRRDRRASRVRAAPRRRRRDPGARRRGVSLGSARAGLGVTASARGGGGGGKTMAHERPGLKKLLAPFSEAEFLAKHWPETPLVLHHGAELVPELTKLPVFQSPASIFAACTGTSVTAMMPDRKDESNSMQVT